MSLTDKIKIRLVFEESTRLALLPKEIDYSGLLSYCKKKFSIEEIDNICLSYEDNSERIDINDDEDLLCCLTTFGVEFVNARVQKIFVDVKKVHTLNSSYGKYLDFPQNVTFYNHPNTSFQNVYDPPDAPDCIIKNTFRHENLAERCFKKGYRFDNKKACMFEIGMKAIMEGFEFCVIKSCTKRYSVRCMETTCPWSIYTNRIKNTPFFETTTFNNLHTCSRTQILPNHRNATKHLVGQLLTEILRDHKRIYKPKDIQKDFNYNWKIDISYKKAWGGKMEALNLLNGSHESSFMQLPIYFHNLKLANKDTVTYIDTDDEGYFQKCFVGFGVLIRSFKSYMRPLIKIDAAHLKGPYLGTNLLAVGMDANNHIIPLATGVSQGETIETWTWFLTKLKECIGEDPNLAIISDRHYSITVACENVFPNAFHGCCCQHLMMNCKFKSDKIKSWFWKTCKAYTVPEFEGHIAGIRALRPAAYKKLEDAGFERWSRAYCLANRYNYMTSNCAESINALTKTVRMIPITNLMDYYRDLIQKWYFERRYTGEVEPAVNELSTWAAEKVRRRMLKSAKWTMKGIDRFRAYQVKDNKTVHVVDLVNRKCSCLKWQKSGLPCGHVCAVSRLLQMSNCNKWAKGWFSKRTLKAMYEEVIYPLPDQNDWETPDDLQVVLPPAIVKQPPGRPKKKDRKKSYGEDPIIIRCGRCDTIGHNRDACHSSLPSQVSNSQTMRWSQYHLHDM